MSDLWITASQDTTQVNDAKLFATLRVEASQFWPFLSDAETTADFTNRLALVGPQIDDIVRTRVSNGAEYLTVRASLDDTFAKDFEVVAAERYITDDRGVRYVGKGRPAPKSFKDPATCGSCGRTWDDGHVTGVTPTPSSRCPFEGMRGHSGSKTAVWEDECYGCGYKGEMKGSGYNIQCPKCGSYEVHGTDKARRGTASRKVAFDYAANGWKEENGSDANGHSKGNVWVGKVHENHYGDGKDWLVHHKNGNVIETEPFEHEDQALAFAHSKLSANFHGASKTAGATVPEEWRISAASRAGNAGTAWGVGQRYNGNANRLDWALIAPDYVKVGDYLVSADGELHEIQPTANGVGEGLSGYSAYNPFSDPQSAYNNPDKGPHKGTPDDLFPDGVPLHGDLTPEQQAWIDKRSSKLAVQGDSFDDEEWEPSDLKSKKPHGPVNRPKDEKVSWGSLHVPCDDCGKPVPAVKFASVSKCASCEAAGHSKYYTGPPPKVDPKVPRFAIDRHLGGVHVGTPDHEVEKQIRDAVAHQRKNDTKGDWTPKIEEQSVKYALWRHHENLGGYRAVMGSAHESRSEIACFNCKRAIHYNEGEGWKDNYTGGECSMGGHHIPVPAREASKTAGPGSNSDPIAYTYEADVHCPGCTVKRFGKEPGRNWVKEDATDREGNPVGVIAPWDETSEDGEYCGTCGGKIAEPWS